VTTSRKLRLSLLFAALTGALFLIGMDELWARAGGGGSFGGGGGGGGGSSGGGGGDGEALFWLLYLAIKYPVVGVPALCIFVLVMVYGGKSAQSARVTRTIRSGAAAQAESQRQEKFAAIKERDPAFEEAEFVQRVKQAFLQIQAAWSEQNLQPVRTFISDGIFERFKLYLEMQKAEGIRNQMDHVTIEDARAIAVYSDRHFDTIHVRFLASAVDYDVSLADGKPIGRRPPPEPFKEYWSFSRRVGAQTRAQAGDLAGNCPNCGAPVAVVDVTRCEACGSTVNSGEHDWVLTEITQAEEWSVPDEEDKIPGLAEFRNLDPEFSMQHVEDRVSVMFWRLRASEFFNNLSYASPILSERFAQLYRERLAQTKSGERTFWKNLAIGRVELIDVQAGAQDGFDRLRAMVRWSGALHQGMPGQESRQVRPQTIRTHLLVLARKQGVQSQTGRAFSAAECTECGAPLAVAKQAQCEYCGRSLVDGEYDWVLDSVEVYTPAMAYRSKRVAKEEKEEEDPLTSESPARASPDMDLAVIAKVMHADGQIDPKERLALSKMATKRGLSSAQLDTAINTARSPDFELPLPQDTDQARRLLSRLVQASLVDGRLDGGEQRMLNGYGARLGLSPADVRLAINGERKRAYQRARRSLKQARKVAGK